ncbi:hypothetical protein [Halorussus amylolyticus]|uniref:hypothetical protein n=1 Tax=Halorussus amylolyticus TaxID=1126242 RepID=UPI00104F2B33|nr:hypothetical protein [Halorussus amylolyticus]
MSSQNVDTSEAFLDNSVLLDYTLDERDDATELFEEYSDVGKLTSENGHEEYEKLKNRRVDFVDWVKEKLNNGQRIGDINPLDFPNLSYNDESFARDLFGECANLESREEVFARLKEERNKLLVGYKNLFEEPLGEVEIIDPSKTPVTDDWDTLHYRLNTVVNNSNDQSLLCDATEWHTRGGSGTFVSMDTSDIVGDREEPIPGADNTIGDFASFALDAGGRQEINDTIAIVYSTAAKLDLLQTREFLDLLP